jgi:hypothetical protein
LVREHCIDFGPTLAAEKLITRHSLGIGVETLRQWMMALSTVRERYADFGPSLAAGHPAFGGDGVSRMDFSRP